MQMNNLKHFVDIAELGSISAAATENFITSQGMSRSLASLETELGCSLFDRKSNRLQLSVYGRELLPYAKKMLQLQAEIMNKVIEVRAHTAKMSRKSVIAYLNSVAFDASLFGPLIDIFDEIFENACYFQCDNRHVVENLLNSQDDDDNVALGLLNFFSPLEQENQQYVALLKQNGFRYQPYILSYDCVLVSAKSDLAHKRSLSRADIVSHPIVVSDGDIRRVLELLYGEKAISMVTADSAFRFHVVESNEALTVVPAFHQVLLSVGNIDLGETVVVPMKDPYYLEIGFAARENVFESDHVSEFFKKLNSYYLKYADSPYLTLISSDLTAIRPDDFYDDAKKVPPRRALRAVEDRYGISPRERDVFECLVEGLTAVPIAEKLYISVATSKSHIYNIYKKMGIHSQNELISLVKCEGEKRGL